MARKRRTTGGKRKEPSAKDEAPPPEPESAEQTASSSGTPAAAAAEESLAGAGLSDDEPAKAVASSGGGPRSPRGEPSVSAPESGSTSETGGEGGETPGEAAEAEAAEEGTPGSPEQGHSSSLAPLDTPARAVNGAEETMAAISDRYQRRLQAITQHRNTRLSQATRLKALQLQNSQALADAETQAARQELQVARELLRKHMATRLERQKQRLQQLDKLLVLDESLGSSGETARLLRGRRKDYARLFGFSLSEPAVAKRSLAPSHLNHLLPESEIVEDLQLINTFSLLTNPKKPRIH